MVDQVVDYIKGEKLTAIKNVTRNEPYFTGHFPQRPVMPGVMIIEALAQASGILTFLTLGTVFDEDNWFFLAGLDNVRYKRIVEPGDQLQLNIEILKARQSIWKFNTTATVNGELACAAEIMNARGKLHDR